MLYYIYIEFINNYKIIQVVLGFINNYKIIQVVLGLLYKITKLYKQL